MMRTRIAASPLARASAFGIDSLARATLGALAVFALLVPVAIGGVGAAAEEAQPAAAGRDHTIDLVIVNPIGVPALTALMQETLTNTAGTAGAFWVRESRSNIPRFTATARHIPISTSSEGCDLPAQSAWDGAAQQLGFSDAQAYLDDSSADGLVHHLVAVLPVGCREVGAAVVSTVGDSTDANGMVFLPLGEWAGAGSTMLELMRELGRNLGIGESDVDYCGADAEVLGCETFSGADYYDIMGATAEWIYGGASRLNAQTRVMLGWNDTASTAELRLTDDESSRTWRVTLASYFCDTTHFCDIVIEDPISGEPYTLEYRSPGSDGYYPGSSVQSLDGRGGHEVNFAPAVRLLHGTATRGSAVVTVAHAGREYVDAAATSLSQYGTGAVMTNPSRSIRVVVHDGYIVGQEIHGHELEVTLARPDVSLAQPVYRFWSDRFQGHFYTINEAEANRVRATWPDVWSFEGARYSAFSTQVPGAVPLFRFWSERYRSHFYTIDPTERDRVLRLWPDVWSYEGVGYYVYPLNTPEPSTVRMARFWSPLNSHHFYTADPVERDRVIRTWPSPIWDYEGDAFRVPFTG